MAPAIIAATLVAGTVTGAVGSVMSGNAAKDAGEFNAQSAERNAGIALEQASTDERNFRIQQRKLEGRNLANVGASGIKLEGSPVDVLRENAANAESDVLNIRRQGQLKYDEYIRQAQYSRMQGAAGQQAGYIGAASQTLTGGANAAKVFK